MARRTKTTAAVQPLPAGPFTVFRPRSYQKPLLAAFAIDPATKRPRTQHGVCEWHRRAGKDLTALAGVAIPAMTFRPGNYYHIFPKYSQGKKILWDGVDRDGKAFLDRFPPHWNPGKTETELMVEMTIPATQFGPGGTARYQVVGADDSRTIDKLVGTNPFGIVYSEAALMTRQVRDLFRPVLRENGGWELFISTPRGKNDFHDLTEIAQREPGWFYQKLTVDQTVRDAPGEDGRRVVTEADIEADRREGMPEELIQQEYYCSHDGYLVGTIFGDVLRQAKADGRVRPLVRDVAGPVGVVMDIGRSDGTAAWFYQLYGREVHWIDYAFTQGKAASDWLHLLKEQKPYLYGRIVLPWDTESETFGQTETVAQFFREHFRCAVVLAPKWPVQTGIDAVRRAFPLFVFDSVRCDLPPDPKNTKVPSGLQALGNYRRDWNEERQDYSGEPVHDIHSHGADALRTGVVGGLTPLGGGWDEAIPPERRYAQSSLIGGRFALAAGRR